jgi:diguanylate cyclase (GGDEF)-like protein
MAAVGLALGFTTLRHWNAVVVPPAVVLPWIALFALFALAELCVVSVQFQQEATTFSLGEVPLVLGLVLVSPSRLLTAQLAACAAVLVLHRRLPLRKTLFNLAKWGAETEVAIVTFRAVLAHGDPFSPRGWLAAGAAVSVASLLGLAAISSAIALTEGRDQLRRISEMAGFGLAASVVTTSMALATVTLLRADPRTVALVVIPFVTLYLAHRAYLHQRAKQDRLEFLYDSARLLQETPEWGSAIVGLLERARDAFRAEVAQLVFDAGDGRGPEETIIGPGEARVVQSRLIEPGTQLVWDTVGASGQPLLLGDDRRVEAVLHGLGLRDAIATSLTVAERGRGMLLLANRRGGLGGFRSSDLRPLQTLAGQVTVALEHGRLEESVSRLTELGEELSKQAFHDGLTGLPNRSRFLERVNEALSVVGHDGTGAVRRPPALLFIDLDDFKKVNDRQGHAAGDELLRVIAGRLEHAIRPGDTAARLAGDEFAVLLAAVDDGPHAHRVASRLLSQLTRTVTIDGQPVTVAASVGVAVAIAGDDADRLLRRADTAMYTAKESGKQRVALFDPSMSATTADRQRLKVDLDRAIAGGELVVHFQPLVSLAHGRVIAAEALVRWPHPTRGLLAPDTFVPFAEETGLIGALGRFVLRAACERAMAWRTQLSTAEDLVVSVNLSPLDLEDGTIVAEVDRVLRATGLPPRLLMLELTETSMLRDVEACIEVLHRLKGLGVLLALDDFGTGYSSLDLLRRLPLDLVKLAKPFVDDLSGGAQQVEFTKAIVQLARTMGLEVVAEGIEDPDQLEVLRSLQCDIGQGHLFSTALDTAAFAAFVEPAEAPQPEKAAITAT